MPQYDDFRSRNITVQSLSASDTSDNERSTPTDAASMSEQLKSSLNQLPLFGSSRRSIARARGSRRSSTARRVSPNSRRTQSICCLPRSVSTTPRKVNFPSKRGTHASTPKYYDYLDFLRRVIKLSQNQTARTRGQSFEQTKPVPSASRDTRRRTVRAESESDDLFDNVVNQPSSTKKSRNVSKSSKRPSKDKIDYVKSPPSTSKAAQRQLLSSRRPAQHSIGRSKSLPSFTKETENQLADIGRSLDDLFDYTKILPCTSKESQRVLESSSKGAHRWLKETSRVSEDSSDSTTSSIKNSDGPGILTTKRSIDLSKCPTSGDKDKSIDPIRGPSQLRADSNTQRSPSTDTTLVAFAIPSKPLPNKPTASDEVKKTSLHSEKDKTKLTESRLTKDDQSQSEAITTRPHKLKPSISVSLPLPSNVNLEMLKKLKCQKTVCSTKLASAELLSDSGMSNKKSILSPVAGTDEFMEHSATKRARSQSFDSKCRSDTKGPSGDTRHSSDDVQRRPKLATRRSSTHPHTSKAVTGKDDVKEITSEAPLKDFIKPPSSLFSTKRPSHDKCPPTTEFASDIPRPAITHVTPTDTVSGHSKSKLSATKRSHDGTKVARIVPKASYSSQTDKQRSSKSASDRRSSEDRRRASEDRKAETQIISKDVKLPLKRPRHLSEGHIPKKIQSLSVSLPLPPNVDLRSLTIARRFSLDAQSHLKDSLNSSQSIPIPTVETEIKKSSAAVESPRFAAECVPEVPLELSKTASNLTETSESQFETKSNMLISLAGPSVVDHTKIELPSKYPSAEITTEIDTAAPCSSKSVSESTQASDVRAATISISTLEHSNPSQYTPGPKTSLLRNTAELANSEIGSSNSMENQQSIESEQVIPLATSSDVQIPLSETLSSVATRQPSEESRLETRSLNFAADLTSDVSNSDIIQWPIPTIISNTPVEEEFLESVPDLLSFEPSTLPSTARQNNDRSRFLLYPRYTTPRPSRFPRDSWRSTGQLMSPTSSSRYASGFSPRRSLGPPRYTGPIRPAGPTRGQPRAHNVQNRNVFHETSPTRHYVPRGPMFSPGPPRVSYDRQRHNAPRPPMTEPGQHRYPIYSSHEPWPGPHMTRGPRSQRYNARHPRQHGYTPRYSPY